MELKRTMRRAFPITKKAANGERIKQVSAQFLGMERRNTDLVTRRTSLSKARCAERDAIPG